MFVEPYRTEMSIINGPAVYGWERENAMQTAKGVNALLNRPIPAFL